MIGTGICSERDDMTITATIVRGVALATAIAAVLTVAACNSSGGGTQTAAATSTTTAADVPTGYDPCTDIPQSVLDDLQLESKIPRESQSDGTKWQGCQWVRADWYGLVIWVTNATIDTVRDHHYQDAQEFTIAGRPAISTRQVPDHPQYQCTVNVTIKGGTLEFFLTNSPSNRMGSDKDSCGMARDAAEKVVPTLPAGV
jgi:hypothetical protein